MKYVNMDTDLVQKIVTDYYGYIKLKNHLDNLYKNINKNELKDDMKEILKHSKLKSEIDDLKEYQASQLIYIPVDNGMKLKIVIKKTENGFVAFQHKENYMIENSELFEKIYSEHIVKVEKYNNPYEEIDKIKEDPSVINTPVLQGDTIYFHKNIIKVSRKKLEIKSILDTIKQINTKYTKLNNTVEKAQYIKYLQYQINDKIETISKQIYKIEPSKLIKFEDVLKIETKSNTKKLYLASPDEIDSYLKYIIDFNQSMANINKAHEDGLLSHLPDKDFVSFKEDFMIIASSKDLSGIINKVNSITTNINKNNKKRKEKLDIQINDSLYEPEDYDDFDF